MAHLGQSRPFLFTECFDKSPQAHPPACNDPFRSCIQKRDNAITRLPAAFISSLGGQKHSGSSLSEQNQTPPFALESLRRGPWPAAALRAHRAGQRIGNRGGQLLSKGGRSTKKGKLEILKCITFAAVQRISLKIKAALFFWAR